MTHTSHIGVNTRQLMKTLLTTPSSTLDRPIFGFMCLLLHGVSLLIFLLISPSVPLSDFLTTCIPVKLSLFLSAVFFLDILKNLCNAFHVMQVWQFAAKEEPASQLKCTLWQPQGLPVGAKGTNPKKGQKGWKRPTNLIKPGMDPEVESCFPKRGNG